MSRAFSTRAVRVSTLDPQDDQAADDERERHRHRLEQIALDHLPDEQPGTAAGRKATSRLRHSCPVDAKEARAVFPHHREHGAGLDRDVEDVAGRVVEAEQVAREYQVAGARDRQEFGETLDDAEYTAFRYSA